LKRKLEIPVDRSARDEHREDGKIGVQFVEKLL
jgi:hypothetical protein